MFYNDLIHNIFLQNFRLFSAVKINNKTDAAQIISIHKTDKKLKRL